MTTEEKFTRERITWLHTWLPGKLFSFRCTRDAGFRFAAGQWARLGVMGPDGKPVWRAYSIVSSPYDEFLEFYSIVVPDGAFTSQLERLQVGDTLLVEKLPYGFLTTARFEGGKDLWLLSSGTGLAPFISVLNDVAVWDQYERLILVHSVREPAELAYAQLIQDFRTHEYFADYFSQQPDKLVYVPVITREPTPGCLSQRIPQAITDGSLESAVGHPLNLERSRIMICGNPQMVDDTRSVLKARGFTVSRSAKPGQIAVENYW